MIIVLIVYLLPKSLLSPACVVGTGDLRTDTSKRESIRESNKGEAKQRKPQEPSNKALKKQTRLRLVNFLQRIRDLRAHRAHESNRADNPANDRSRGRRIRRTSEQAAEPNNKIPDSRADKRQRHNEQQ